MLGITMSLYVLSPQYCQAPHSAEWSYYFPLGIVTNNSPSAYLYMELELCLQEVKDGINGASVKTTTD